MFTLLLSLQLCLSFPNEMIKNIGLQIWENECHQSIKGLLSWNEGENFLSLGIGHFIWLPENSKDVFEETFPKLLEYCQMHNVKLPKWLTSYKHCPWNSKEDFIAAKEDVKMKELSQLLSNTIDLQISFLFERFQKIEPLIIENTSKEKKQNVIFVLETLKRSPQGVYALIDYVNFKGTGLSLRERYAGKGWGLLQVLEQIPSNIPEEKILSEFILSAKNCLTMRVNHAPKERKEDRWLKGWFLRLETYAEKRF